MKTLHLNLQLSNSRLMAALKLSFGTPCSRQKETFRCRRPLQCGNK